MVYLDTEEDQPETKIAGQDPGKEAEANGMSELYVVYGGLRCI
jgi:hypothetical protein